MYMNFSSGYVSKLLLTFKVDFKMSPNKRTYIITTGKHRDNLMTEARVTYNPGNLF